MDAERAGVSRYDLAALIEEIRVNGFSNLGDSEAALLDEAIASGQITEEMLSRRTPDAT